MTNNISVTLDTSVSPNVLNVDDKGGIKISKNPNPQKIRWNLTGNLAKAEFVSLCGNSPGFEWVSNPPPSTEVFSQPVIEPNGDSLHVMDNHPNGASTGTWIYRLRVLLDGTVYQTTSQVSIAATSKNPIIIND